MCEEKYVGNTKRGVSRSPDQIERKCGGISECLDALANDNEGIKENATSFLAI